MDQGIKLEITVDDKGTVKVKQFGKELEGAAGKGSAGFKGASAALAGFKDKLLPTSSLITKVGVGIAAWKLAGIAKDFLTTASSMETYRTTLTTVLKSTERASDMMKWIKDFAATTPFEIPGLVESATRLEAYGLDAKKYMRTLGDTAASMGKPIMSAVEMIADASQGEFERMKEFGLRASDVAAAAGFATVKDMTSTRENLAKGTETLMSMLEERYSGGMEKLSKTMGGMWSNVKDLYTQFQMAVMEGGVFDFLKAGLATVLDYLNKLKAEGKMGEWAKTMAEKVVSVLEWIIKGAALVADAFRGWKMIWEGLKLGFNFLAEQVTTGMIKILEVTKSATDVIAPEKSGSIGAAIIKLTTAQRGFSKSVDESTKKLEDLADQESTYKKATKLIDKMKDKAASYSKTLDKEVIPSTKEVAKITEKTTADIVKDTQKAAKEREKLEKKLTQDIKKLSMDEKQYKFQRIDEMVQKARQAGVEEQQIQQWAAYQKMALYTKESAEYKRLTGEAKDYKLQQINEIVAEAQKAGVEEQKIQAWVNEQKSAFYGKDAAERKKIEEQQLRDAQQAATNKLTAYRSMYQDLKGMAWENYDVQVGLLKKQRDEYIKATGDEVAANEWFKQSTTELWIDSARKSNDFFAGMRAGLLDSERSMKSFGEVGYQAVESLRQNWKSSVNDMVDAYIAGEDTKKSVAQVTGQMLSQTAGDISKQMYANAIDKTIALIGAQLGQGAAGAGAKGSIWGGTLGALAEIGLYLGSGVAAMLAARSMANKFRAKGGWIEAHPMGGMIRQGSHVQDDVFLGHTPGTRHWGMGGEYVINQASTKKHLALIEAINRDRGMMTGGYINRDYAEGDYVDWKGEQIPWKPTADSLALGSAMSFGHGFAKGGIIGAVIELIAFFAAAVTGMFTGKYMAKKFMASGGMVEDVGYGFFSKIFKPLRRILDPFDTHVFDPGERAMTNLEEQFTKAFKVFENTVPIFGEELKYFRTWLTGQVDKDEAYNHIKTLIRLPLEQIARDLVTPNVYYSDPISGVKRLLRGMKDLAESSLPRPQLEWMHGLGYMPGYERGIDYVPRTGPAIVHRGERIIDAGTNRGMKTPQQRVTISINTDVITTDNVDAWLAERLERLRERRVGRRYETVDLSTVGIKL